jgi:hypothetical protein
MILHSLSITSFFCLFFTITSFENTLFDLVFLFVFQMAKNALISDVTEKARNLVLTVRAVRMWLVSEFSNPHKSHSLELVLQDREVD